MKSTGIQVEKSHKTSPSLCFKPSAKREKWSIYSLIFLGFTHWLSLLLISIFGPQFSFLLNLHHNTFSFILCISSQYLKSFYLIHSVFYLFCSDYNLSGFYRCIIRNSLHTNTKLLFRKLKTRSL